MIGDPEFEVVVVGYNTRESVLRCLESVRAQRYDDFSVTYVDNGSSDGSVAVVHEQFPEVTLLAFSENLGFATACNRAIARSEAPYVALLNPDAIAPDGWLSAYADAIEDGADDVLAWGGRIRLAGSDRLHYAGTKLTPMGSAVNPALLTGDDGSTEDCRDSRPTAAPCGANAVVDVESFESIGGFDDDFFLYFEDADLGWRAWLSGYRVAYVPDAVVDHDLGGAVGGQSPFSTPRRVRHAVRNRKAMLLKNADRRLLTTGLILTVGYDLLVLTSAIRRGRRAVVRAMLCGEAALVRDLPSVLARRRAVQRSRRRSDVDLRSLGLFCSLTEAVRFYRRLRREYR